MDTKTLDKKLNKALGYHVFLAFGIFVLVLAILMIAIQLAGVMDNSSDKDIIRLVTIGITAWSVLVIGISGFLMLKKKDYAKIMQVSAQDIADITDDFNRLAFDSSTFALGSRYAYFYGKLVRDNRKFFCIPYTEIARAEFLKWRGNEQILFYDRDDEWIATVGGYKKHSGTIKSILSQNGVQY
jgi:hypothetical protein